MIDALLAVLIVCSTGGLGYFAIRNLFGFAGAVSYWLSVIVLWFAYRRFVPGNEAISPVSFAIAVGFAYVGRLPFLYTMTRGQMAGRLTIMSLKLGNEEALTENNSQVGLQGCPGLFAVVLGYLTFGYIAWKVWHLGLIAIVLSLVLFDFVQKYAYYLLGYIRPVTSCPAEVD